jgi:hypothetical protein
MRQRLKRQSKEPKKISIEEHNKRYTKRMKELMPDQFTEEPTSLEEKIDKEINLANEEFNRPSTSIMRQYWLGKRRALEWVKRELNNGK